MNGYNHLWSLYFQTDLCVCACGVLQYCSVHCHFPSTSYHHIADMSSMHGTSLFLLSSGEQQLGSYMLVLVWVSDCSLT